jgi:lysozyme
VAKKTRKTSNKLKRKPETIYFRSMLLVFTGIALFAFFIFVRNKVREARWEIAKEKIVRAIPFGFSSFGIDISHHQGEIDWNELIKDQGYDTIIHFVYCKTSEGTDHLDTKWYHNRKFLRKLNIPNGAYHFFRTTDPIKQADFFLTHWKHRPNDLPPMLDVEYECAHHPQLIADMRLWLKRVEKKTGLRPIIYTSLHLYETKFQNDLNDYKFWIASYSRRPAQLDTDQRIIHWQYSCEGHLPGIDHRIDMNVSKILIQP